MKTVPLTKGKVALVDDADFELVSKRKWVFNKEYAQSSDGKTTHLMHRLIIGAEKGQITDHINGDTLDNRRKNLRIATSAQNSWNRRLAMNNTSGYRGVQRGGRRNPNRWRATISIDGRRTHLGYFSNPEEAALAYDNAAIKHYGDFASLNGGSSSV